MRRVGELLQEIKPAQGQRSDLGPVPSLSLNAGRVRRRFVRTPAKDCDPHCERSYRLDALANEARKGLERVESGEEFTISGWLMYGAALNEGRALFDGDREFGKWIVLSQLATAQDGRKILRDDRVAAMWAAVNVVQFDEARQRGNPRTIRGIHAKWKEIEAERAEAEARRKAEEAEEENTGDTADEAPAHGGETDPVAADPGASSPAPVDDPAQTPQEPTPPTEDPAIAEMRREFRTSAREAP